MSGAGNLLAADENPESTVELTAISFQGCKEETLIVLKAELMDKLNKEIKSLDDDGWMFDGPRSCIHLISGPGGVRHKCPEISNRWALAPQK